VRSEPEVEGKAPLGLVEEAEVGGGSDGQVLDRLRRRLECELSTKNPQKSLARRNVPSELLHHCVLSLFRSIMLSSYLRSGRTERGACLPITSVTPDDTTTGRQGDARELRFRSLSVGADVRRLWWRWRWQ
jgi:hypothetical protein